MLLNKSGAPYAFSCKDRVKINNGTGQICNHVYTFRTKHGLKYIVELPEYKIGVYGVKFCLGKHKRQPNKYKYLSGKGDGIVVLKTVVAIMLDVLRMNETASFAFFGMPLLEEGIEHTKRYNVYRAFSQRYFNPNNFEHYFNEKYSFYSLLNKKNNPEKLTVEVEQVASSELKNEIDNAPVSFSRSTTI